MNRYFIVFYSIYCRDLGVYIPMKLAVKTEDNHYVNWQNLEKHILKSIKDNRRLVGNEIRLTNIIELPKSDYEDFIK